MIPQLDNFNLVDEALVNVNDNNMSVADNYDAQNYINY